MRHGVVEPIDPKLDAITVALEEARVSQQSLLQTIGNWKDDPNEENENSLVPAGEQALTVMRGALDVIVNAPDVSRRDKASYVAALLRRTDRTRVNFFLELMPDAQFYENPRSHKEILEEFTAIMDNEDPENIIDKAVREYKGWLKNDLELLEKSIEEEPAAQAADTDPEITIEHKTGSNARSDSRWEIAGKLAIGFSIGIVLGLGSDALKKKRT